MDKEDERRITRSLGRDGTTFTLSVNCWVLLDLNPRFTFKAAASPSNSTKV